MKGASIKRSGTIPGDGALCELYSWLTIQYVLAVLGSLQYAITYGQYARAVTSGTALFKLCVTIAMPLKAVKSAMQ